MRVIRAGDVGSDVRDVQDRLLTLGAPIASEELERGFGPSTEAAVRWFQAERRLPVDGLVGPDTWGQLVEAGYALGDRALYLRYPFIRGDDVRALQRRLNALGFDAGREDGILGRETDAAIRDFQRNVGQDTDGIVGPDTVTTLARLRPQIGGPSRAVVREAASLREPHGSIANAVIALDPGHGGADAGVRGPAGLCEAEATFVLAGALRRHLDGRGAATLLLRDASGAPDPRTRASAANDAAAAACVSLHLGADASDGPGASCAFFGTSTTHSPAGQRLAELIQGRLCDGVGLKDLGAQRLAISILRETKMPAVLVQPCRIALAEEEERLRDPNFVDQLAGAIADALEEYLV